MFAACNRLCSCRSFHLNLTANWFLQCFAGWKLVDRQKERSVTGLQCVNFSGHCYFNLKKTLWFYHVYISLPFSAWRSTQGPRRKSPVRVRRVSLARVKTAKARMEKVMAKERKVKEKERKTGVTGSSLGIQFIKVLQEFRISANVTITRTCHEVSVSST